MTADQLAALLDELGKRLGPAGERAFQLAVQRQIISATVEAIAALFVMTLCVTAIVLAGLYWRHEIRARAAKKAAASSWSSYDDNNAVGGFIFGMTLLVAGLLTIFAAIFLAESIINLLTPEYAAIQDILRAVKP